MFLLFVSLLFAAEAAVTAPQFSELFSQPYRTVSSVIVKSFQQQTDVSSVAVSYMGWAQIPSSKSSNRLIFHVHPNSDQTVSLPKVYIYQDKFLAANITTTFGNEMLIGPNITLDTWFSFGIAIDNGIGRNVTFYLSYRVTTAISIPTYAIKTLGLQGDMLTSSTAMATVNAVSLTTNPVPVYLTQLRVFAVAMDELLFEVFRTSFPMPFVYQTGAQITALVFERLTVGANVSCPNNLIIASIDKAMFGRPVWPTMLPNPACDVGASAVGVAQSACLGRRSCLIPRSNDAFGSDPCKGWSKWTAVTVTCNKTITQTIAPSLASSSPSSRSPSATISSSATRSPSPSSTLSSNRTVSFSPQTIPGSKPTTSSTQPTTSASSPSTLPADANAWRLSLTVDDSIMGMSDSVIGIKKSTFIDDMSLALSEPSSRFPLLLVQLQSQTRSSTSVSFVILPSTGDPDGSILVDLFYHMMQIPGSSLRNGELLRWAGDPPVPITIEAIHVFQCASGAYAFDANSCPSAAPSTVSSASEPLLGRMQILIAGSVALLILIVTSLYIWMRFRSVTPAAATTIPTNVQLPAVNPVQMRLDNVYVTGNSGRGQNQASAHSSSASVNGLTAPLSYNVSSSRDSTAAVSPSIRIESGEGRYSQYFSRS